MNLIKKELIKEAFVKYNREFFKSKEYFEKFKDDDYKLGKHDFEKGVDFAESQLEKLAIEFVEWLFVNTNKYLQVDINHFMYIDENELYSTQEVFQQFIKEKNGD